MAEERAKRIEPLDLFSYEMEDNFFVVQTYFLFSVCCNEKCHNRCTHTHSHNLYIYVSEENLWFLSCDGK